MKPLLMGLSVALLGACDFAPPAIDYDRSGIGSEDELYNVAIDWGMGQAVAGLVAADCPDYVLDQQAVDFHGTWIEAEAEVFFAANPNAERSFLRRLGSSATSFEEYSETGAGFDLPAPLKVDLVGRVVTYFIARGFPFSEDGMCRAGRAEVRQNTLAGSFLMPVARVDDGIIAIPQFAVPEPVE